MAMDQAAPAPEMAPEQGQSPGGAAQLAADTHSSLLKFADLVGGKYPEEGKALSALVSQFQQIVDSLGQSPDAPPPGAQAQTMPHGVPAGAKPVM